MVGRRSAIGWFAAWLLGLPAKNYDGGFYEWAVSGRPVHILPPLQTASAAPATAAPAAAQREAVAAAPAAASSGTPLEAEQEQEEKEDADAAGTPRQSIGHKTPRCGTLMATATAPRLHLASAF